jgi:hypothetical protein
MAWDKEKKGYKLKANWRNHPDDMLFARCVSKGYRRYCADLSSGVLAYDPDELGELPAIPAAPAPAPAPPVEQQAEAPAPRQEQAPLINSVQAARIEELCEQLKVDSEAFKKRIKKALRHRGPDGAPRPPGRRGDQAARTEGEGAARPGGAAT